ncbi:MAG: hypothetical protein C3F17_18930 [Bradyrhizobiaceae bacterium]|nr:MAG: hypothetical protein C3F17_18930 [Bradyrhizobiaceae bacterium]
MGRSLYAFASLAVALLPQPARADLQLCNKTSYVLEAVLGLEDKGARATRGWFRIDPGQCRGVLSGAVEAEKLYVHARALPVYGASPLPQTGHADLCVADGDFVIAAAGACNARRGQRLARFTAVRPAETEQGLAANLAEEADYSAEQARLAGIQRLLVLAGYDANPIDGIEGRKTSAALDQFLTDRRLGSEAASGAGFFDVLLAAVKSAEGIGFSWCNETAHTVMAALGVEGAAGIVTRGWYRVEPGKCVKPEVPGKPGRLYSFGEAVDKDGQAIRRAEQALAWGGATTLCTRAVRFELAEQGDCAARGLDATGFATIDLAGRLGATVRFRE